MIGARPPLIAFNVYLDSSDTGIAKAVAKAVRHSSGGLRYVKALGLSVDGLAQVSMNLTDHTRTPLARVVELVRTEARRHGVEVLRSELVGLTPQRALVDAAAWYLQLDGFEPGQVLETRLGQASDPATAPLAFLETLAAGTPTPGGGAAAAVSGAMAAALAGMVSRLTVGKKKYAEVEGRMREVIEAADDLKVRLALAAEEDSAAFEAVLSAMRLPRESEVEQEARQGEIRRATIQAARIPLQVAIAAAQAAELAAEVAETGNLNAISDAASAVALARAALQGAALNVRINARDLESSTEVNGWEATLSDCLLRMAAAEGRARQALASRARIEF